MFFDILDYYIIFLILIIFHIPEFILDIILGHHTWTLLGHRAGMLLEHSWEIDGALISGVWDHAATEIPEMQQEDTEAHQYIMNVCTHHLMQYMYINITSIDISVNKWFRVASMTEAPSIPQKRKLGATRDSNKAMGCTVAVIGQGHLPTPQNWHCALTGSWSI